MTQWSGKQRRWANPVACSIPRWAQGSPRKFQQWGDPPHPQGEEWAKETVCPTLSAGAIRYIHAYFFFHTNLIFARNSNLLLLELVSISLPHADFVTSLLSAHLQCLHLSRPLWPSQSWLAMTMTLILIYWLTLCPALFYSAYISSFHPHQRFMRNVLLLCWKLSPSKIKTNLHLKLTLYSVT